MHTVLRNRGFTVIEPLIVVIIVAIIVSIIISALYAAKHKADHVTCINNMRQLFLAFEQYVNDNNGLLPRPNHSNTSKDGTKNCNAEVWFKAVNNYLTTSPLPGKRDEISQEERLLRVKQDPVFKTVPLSEQVNTRTIKMNQNLVPVSDCQQYY
jgi:prepilin-type N-terminal cleavage/methylation domain-containing protein